MTDLCKPVFFPVFRQEAFARGWLEYRRLPKVLYLPEEFSKIGSCMSEYTFHHKSTCIKEALLKRGPLCLH